MGDEIAVSVDIAEVESFANEVLPGLLVSNCTDITVAMFVLDCVLRRIDEIKN